MRINSYQYTDPDTSVISTKYRYEGALTCSATSDYTFQTQSFTRSNTQEIAFHVELPTEASVTLDFNQKLEPAYTKAPGATAYNWDLGVYDSDNDAAIATLVAGLKELLGTDATV